MIKKYALPQVITALILLLSFKLALAVIPSTLNYQGHLTGSGGAPVDGPVNMVFAIYDVETGGTALWSDSLSVTVNQGVFSVELGAVSPLPPGLFELSLWVGLTVDTDAEMAPRRPVSSVGFSFKAGDADRLEGISASTLDQSTHVTDFANPHSVTATLVGAATSADISTHAVDASAHHIKTSTFPELSGQIADAQIPPLIARDAEIMSTVLAGDGPGSTLNADMLDGYTSAAFMFSSADLWVNTTGDTMTGDLNILANVGIGTSSPTERLDVNGNLFMSGGDIKTDRWLQSTVNTGIGVGVFGGGNLTRPAGTYDGLYNTAVGHQALYSDATGASNTAIGYQTLLLNSSGRYNSALGANALRENYTGTSNTAIGYSALKRHGSNFNTAIGANALRDNSGDYNTAMGANALYTSKTGLGNTVIGSHADYYNLQGNSNTIIGTQAGYGSTTHTKSGNVFIGYRAGFFETGSDKLYIANSSTNFPLIYGNFATARVGIGTNSPGYKLEVDSGSAALPLMLRTTEGFGYMGAGNAGYFHFYTDRPAFYFSKQVQCTGGCVTYSDISLKMDIEPVTTALEKITRLNGVTWNWKEENLSRARQMGLIAQNVEEVAPELVEDTTNGKTMNYDGLSALTVEAIKELKVQNDQLRAELKEIKSQLKRLVN